jgi:hypothetical protein
MHDLGVAVQIYLLGFVIALAMACIIKLMMLFFSISAKKGKGNETAAPADNGNPLSRGGEGGES